MSSGDFDIASLASFLHLTPQKVTRMADRGKLPGRKAPTNERKAPTNERKAPTNEIDAD